MRATCASASCGLKRLGEAIEAQDGLALLWSSARGLALCHLEWTTALALERPILSCLLDATKLPASLRAAMPSRCGGFDGGLRRLAAELAGAAAPAATPRKQEVFAELERENDPSVERALELLLPLLGGADKIHIHVNRGGAWSRRIMAAALALLALAAIWTLRPQPPPEAKLSMRVLKGAPPEAEPAAGATAYLYETGAETRTNEHGGATFALPPGLGPGGRVTVNVKLDSYKLYRPTEGKIPLPVYEALDVELRPWGSPDFYSDESMSGLLPAALEHSRAATPEETGERTPFLRYVDRWSLERGVDSGLVQAKLAELGAAPRKIDLAPPPADPPSGRLQWVRNLFGAEQGSADFASTSPDVRREALGAVGRGEFGEAARLFESIEAWSEAGDAWKNAGELARARAAYERALTAIDPVREPFAFAAIENKRGEALQAGGDAQAAMAAFGAALSASRQPEIQRNFAVAVSAVARDAPPEDKPRLFEEANRNFDEAAGRYERLGRDGERVETELAKAAVMSTRSRLAPPAEAPRILDEAIAARREAAASPLLPADERVLLLEGLSDDLLLRGRMTTGAERSRFQLEAGSVQRQMRELDRARPQ